MASVKCYIKGEESNAEKRARDTKERSNTNSYRRGFYPLPAIDMGTFKREDKRLYGVNKFTPLNTHGLRESTRKFFTPN